MLSNGPYRTVPLSLGRQFIGFGNPFLGQTPPDTRSLNRLENLTIPEIQNRILIAPPLLRLQDAIAKAAAQGGGYRGGFGGQGQGFRTEEQQAPDPALSAIQAAGLKIPTLSNDERTVLTQISMDPTADELADLAIIDGFFGVGLNPPSQYAVVPSLTPGVCKALSTSQAQLQAMIENAGSGERGGFGSYNYKMTVADAVAAWMVYAPQPQGRGWFAPKPGPSNATPDEVDAIKNSNFFCETPNGYPDIVYWGGKGNYAGWFGIDGNQAWGNIKLQVKNAITIMSVIASYPFPPPIDQYQAQFWVTAMPDIQKLINIGSPVDPDAVRYWVTLSVVANYSAMVDRIQADLKRAAKKAKRKAMMAAIGLAIASIVAAFILPAVIAAAVAVIKTVVQTEIDIQKRKEAAKQMADTAKLFEKDAPAFSAEVTKAGMMMDEAAAIEASNAAPSPEMKAAITEVAADTPSTGVSPLIPGGIAAAGLAAFLIFR